MKTKTWILLAFVTVLFYALGTEAVKVFDEETSQQLETVRQAEIARTARPDALKGLNRLDVREACAKHEDWDIESCRLVDAKKVAVGMTAEQARLAWGKPKSVNSTITSSRNLEQWVYGSEYVYVEDGKVTSMQTWR